MKNRTKLIRAVPALLAGLALLLVVACGNVGGTDSSGSGGGGGPTITVGSKNFTEQFILGNMYVQALDANGFNGVAKLDLGSEQIADKALQNGQIDLYPEYTGTSLVAIVPYKGNPADLNTPEGDLRGRQEGLRRAQSGRHDAEPAPFNNTYGIFVRKSVAEKNGLTNMDELAQDSPNLTFISYSEFQNRSDGYPNMQKNYPALDFKEIKIVNELGLRYSGLESGEGDVGVGFTTDGQLTSDQLVVMKDPKSIWPFYYPAPVVRSDVLKKYPKIEEDPERGLGQPRRGDDARAERAGRPGPGGPRGRRQTAPRRGGHHRVGRRRRNLTAIRSRRNLTGGSFAIEPPYPATRACHRQGSCRTLAASDTRERGGGEDHLYRDLEVLGDLQREVQAGAILAPLEVAHGLVVDPERIGQVAGARCPFRRAAWLCGCTWSRSPAGPLHSLLAPRIHGGARLAPRHPSQHDRRQDEAKDCPYPQDPGGLQMTPGIAYLHAGK